MTREHHVRFCEGLGGRFPGATRLVVLCRSREDAAEAMRRLKCIFERLRLDLHPEKTRLVEIGLGLEGFVFLGCYLRVVKSRYKRRTYLFRWPARRAMKAIRAKIRTLTDRRRRAGMKDIEEVIADLNPVLRGWGNHFKTGNAAKQFGQIDDYVWTRLVRLQAKHGGQRRQKSGGKPFTAKDWPHSRFVQEHDLYQLRGTIRYPGRTNAT